MFKKNGNGRPQFDGIATFNLFIQTLVILVVVMAAYFTTIGGLTTEIEMLCVKMEYVERHVADSQAKLRTLELGVASHIGAGGD